MNHLYSVKYSFPNGGTNVENRAAVTPEKAAAQIIAENPGAKLVAVWVLWADGYDTPETIGPVEARKRCKKLGKSLSEVSVDFFELTDYSLYTNDMHPTEGGFCVEVVNLELQLASYKK